MIYLISHSRYKEHFKTGPYKYLPDFLLPKYRPRVIDNVIKEEEVIGRILGINLKDVDLTVDSNLDVYINSILQLKTEEDTYLYIDGLENIDKDILEEIETRTSMSIPSGEDIWLYNVPLVINQLLQKLDEDSFGEEVLIICGDKEQSIGLIKSLSEFLSFISIIGNDEDVLEEAYERILEETGISLFQPANIEKTIKKYNIIINLCEDFAISLRNIRRKAIIFDISNSKQLRSLGEDLKNKIIIEGVNLNIKDSGILKNQWFGEVVPSNLYQFLMGDEQKEFYKVKWRGEYYFLKDFINKAIRLKGNI